MAVSIEDEILAQEWFYRYTLPSGRTTRLYIPESLAEIHDTRLAMMNAALAPYFARGNGQLTAIDFASHQGFFSYHLAQRCKTVTGLEYQPRHVAAANLIKQAYGLDNLSFVEEDVGALPRGKHEPADIVINFGLMYHVENPIGVLRRCRELTKQILLVETQTTILDMEGAVDSGHAGFTKHMYGYWGLFDGDVGDRDGAASDIVFYPSPKGLIWVLKKLGFSSVEVLPPPPGAFQQLATGKRIMVAAQV